MCPYVCLFWNSFCLLFVSNNFHNEDCKDNGTKWNPIYTNTTSYFLFSFVNSLVSVGHLCKLYALFSKMMSWSYESLKSYDVIMYKKTWRNDVIMHWSLVFPDEPLRHHLTFWMIDSYNNVHSPVGRPGGNFYKSECNLWPQNGVICTLIIMVIIIIRRKCVYIFILQLTSLPVCNGYYGFNKAGLPPLQQWMLYLYPQLLQPQGYTYAITCIP